MKRLYLTLLIGILLVSSAIAVDIGLSSWSDDLDLTREQEDALKEIKDVDKIDVKISPITCDNKRCWASVIWEGEKNEWVIDNVGNSTEELKEMVKDYTERIMRTWAVSKIEDRIINAEILTDEGRLEVSK